VEGLPIVILEAASFALPVIASDVGSVAALLTSDEPGGDRREICPLVPAGDSAALARQMSRLAHDAALRREMGSGLYDHAARHFSADVQVERLSRIYDTALRRRDKPRARATHDSEDNVRRASPPLASRAPSLVAGKSG
jgi:glycosyltransferase involved in cell wall biosynthesis